MSADEANKGTQQVWRHIRAGQPAPEGDTHVVLAAEDYELLRQLNSGKLDPFLADVALEFALLKQLVRDAGTAAMTWADAQDIARRALLAITRVAKSSEAAHNKMAAMSYENTALTTALTAMVDRWEPDSAGADRRMWLDACWALGRKV